MNNNIVFDDFRGFRANNFKFDIFTGDIEDTIVSVLMMSTNFYRTMTSISAVNDMLMKFDCPPNFETPYRVFMNNVTDTEGAIYINYLKSIQNTIRKCTYKYIGIKSSEYHAVEMIYLLRDMIRFISEKLNDRRHNNRPHILEGYLIVQPKDPNSPLISANDYNIIEAWKVKEDAWESFNKKSLDGLRLIHTVFPNDIKTSIQHGFK